MHLRPLVLACILLSLTTLRAQQRTDAVVLPDSVATVQAVPDASEKLLYLLGASVFFAGFDYLGYNATRRHPNALRVYRVLQGLTQIAISWFLYEQFGLPTAIGFNVIWWTFGDDFLYYGYAELINPGHPWESRGDLGNGVLSNRCTWAYWTPVGIMRGMKRNQAIAGSTLVAQSLVGLGAALTITLSF
jgi:hypothetical protein